MSEISPPASSSSLPSVRVSQAPPSPSFWSYFQHMCGTLRDSPRGLWVVFLLKYLESYAYFIFAYTLILFLSDEFNFSDEEAGIAYGIYGMLVSGYGLLMGTVIDSSCVKSCLTLGTLLLFFARIVVATTESPRFLGLVLFTILPLGGTLGVPVMQIAIKRYSSPEIRSECYSIFYTVMNLAAITAAPCIDAFHKHFPEGVDMQLEEGGGMAYLWGSSSVHISTHRLLLLSGSFMTLVSFLVAVFLLDDAVDVEREEEGEDGERLSPFDQYKKVFSSPPFWRLFCLVTMLLGVRVVYRHLDATFPKYMVRVFGPHSMYGSVIAVNPISVVVLTPVLMPIFKNWGTLNLIIIGSLISCLAPFLLALGHSYFTAVGFVAILSLGETIWSPRLYEYTMAVAEPGREGTYMALSSAPMFIGTMIAGSSSGVLLDYFCPEEPPRHPETMWLVIGVISLISPVALILFRGWVEDPSALSRSSSRACLARASKEGRGGYGAAGGDLGNSRLSTLEEEIERGGGSAESQERRPLVLSGNELENQGGGRSEGDPMAAA